MYDRTSYVEAPVIAQRIGGAEVIITNKTPISTKTMDQCPNLKLIAFLATGYNVADYNYAKEKGILMNNGLKLMDKTVAWNVKKSAKKK